MVGDRSNPIGHSPEDMHTTTWPISQRTGDHHSVTLVEIPVSNEGEDEGSPLKRGVEEDE